MTFDDIRRPDPTESSIQRMMSSLNPIAGAGFSSLRPGIGEFVFTDAQGRFTLNNVPAGDVKLVIDGRTATNAPSGYYFPEMVMDVTIEPGFAKHGDGAVWAHRKNSASMNRATKKFICRVCRNRYCKR